MKTVRELAQSVLALQAPKEKIAAIRIAHQQLLHGRISLGEEVKLTTAPAPCPSVVPLKEMERASEGVNREVMLLHSIAHIEYNAINLYWDMLGRFSVNAPESFYTDFSRIACDEAEHFEALDARLQSLNSSYGKLQVHNALSTGLQSTSEHVLDRIVLTSLVHEARALDSHKRLASKFNSFNSDKQSVKLLDWIVKCEVDHVRVGLKWFRFFSASDQKREFQTRVKKLVGRLRPPFNVQARTEAGFPRDWYEKESSLDAAERE